MSERKSNHCAIYTRKSTEHNLDLEFNSLQAQREACEAYIKSQKHEGWELVPDQYDDGGISGGSLERPDLQRLLSDIKASKIDTVVVYKVDRLTRSLTDFAKLVELFDAHKVSFVSVTQAFNTTNSMGRLTLNVLLSFAQFERELIGERVRDKVAASKRKGLWMGGTVPLGYANRDKKLIVVPEEAETIRWIFHRYLQLGSIIKLLRELNERGIKTKMARSANGRTRGGVRFGRGSLNHVLKNRSYIGEIAYRGEIHIADHAPILDKDLFEAVQTQLKSNVVTKKLKLNASGALLAGRIFDSAGNRMTPSHCVKKGARYHYYVSQAVIQCRMKEAGCVPRVSAPNIETLVAEALRMRFHANAGVLRESDVKALLQENVSRIVINAGTIEIHLRGDKNVISNRSGKAGPDRSIVVPWSSNSAVALKDAPLAASDNGQPERYNREAFLTAIGKARLWTDEILKGKVVSFTEIAKREGKGERQIRLLAPLAFVPPDTVAAIAEGRGNVTTVTKLARNVPWIWDEGLPNLVPAPQRDSL